MMDTSKLKAGQKVWMRSGDERSEGTIRYVVEKGIEVEVDPDLITTASKPTIDFCGIAVGYDRRHSPSTLRLDFDRNGKQTGGYMYLSDVFDLAAVLRGKSGEPWELEEADRDPVAAA